MFQDVGLVTMKVHRFMVIWGQVYIPTYFFSEWFLKDHFFEHEIYGSFISSKYFYYRHCSKSILSRKVVTPKNSVIISKVHYSKSLFRKLFFRFFRRNNLSEKWPFGITTLRFFKYFLEKLPFGTNNKS